MASTEDYITVTFDLDDVESLMAALLVASWHHRRPEDRENANRLYKQVVTAAGSEFFGAALRAQKNVLPGTNLEDGGGR